MLAAWKGLRVLALSPNVLMPKLDVLDHQADVIQTNTIACGIDGISTQPRVQSQRTTAPCWASAYRLRWLALSKSVLKGQTHAHAPCFCVRSCIFLVPF